MKKLLYILLGLILLLVAAAVAVPIIFKDDIKAAIDEQIEASVNADVVFDVENLDISLFSNFPNLTVSMTDFGVINRAPFEGHILFVAESFELEVNLMSVINGEMRLKGLAFNQPEIRVKVLEDGTANYDIAIPSEEVPVEEEVVEESGEFSFGIDHWAINNARIIYDDATLPFLLDLEDFTHTGGGDFSQDLFDLTTKTTVGNMNVAFDGVEYISNKQLSIDLILAISDEFSKFTFKDNLIKLNDFAFAFDGFVAMNGDDIDTDLTFSSNDNTFKSILSLVPGVFLEGFEDIQTKGEFSFGGMAKGIYNESRIPAFNLNFEVKDAMFKYPDLPTAVTDINVKTLITNADGNIDNTIVDVSTFHVNMGGNPFDASLMVSELNDIKWDLKVNGHLDMNTINQMMPMEGTTLAGVIDMDMQTKGQLSVLEAEQYDKLPTNGSINITEFKYTDETLDYDVAIDNTSASFNPQEIELSSFEAQIGKSDMQMNGKISNYLGYVFSDEQVLKGNVNFTSSLLDLDELSGSSEEEAEQPEVEEDTTAMEVIPIPANIDFLLNSTIKTVKVSDMTLENAEGEIIIKDGIANLSGLKFNTLGGEFVVNGSYNTQDINKPSYDFKLNIKDLSISESYKTFNTVQKFAPIAENMIGNLTTEMGISGLLQQDMMPDLNSVSAEGLLNIAKAALKGSSVTSGLSKVANLKSEGDELTLNDILLNFTIEDGNLDVKPFDLKLGNYKANVGGKSSLAGDLDYNMDMQIPAGAVGEQVNNLLSKYGMGGGNKSTINLPIKIGGTVDDPKYSLGKRTDSEKPKVTDVAKNVLTETAGVDVDAEKEKIMADAKKQADAIKSTAQIQADKVKKEGYAQADKLVAQAGSNPIAKRVAQEAAKKAKAETDKQVNKILQDANQQADKLMKDAEAKAAKI